MLAKQLVRYCAKGELKMTKKEDMRIMHKGCLFNSRLEAKWAAFFDACGVEWEYKPKEYDLGNGVKYHPSFLLNDVKGVDGGKLYIAVTNKVTFLRDDKSNFLIST